VEPVTNESVARGIAGRIEHLFDAVRNPSTEESYTNAEAARMTLCDLSEEVAGIRTGALVTQLHARWSRSRGSSEWSPHTF
jgi:hypothetical protein